MKKPKIPDQECIDRFEAAAEALLGQGGSHAQVVGALTATIVNVACRTPLAARSLRLAIEILSDAAGQTPDENIKKAGLLN